jgi:hypothetical protein
MPFLVFPIFSAFFQHFYATFVHWLSVNFGQCIWCCSIILGNPWTKYLWSCRKYSTINTLLHDSRLNRNKDHKRLNVIITLSVHVMNQTISPSSQIVVTNCQLSLSRMETKLGTKICTGFLEWEKSLSWYCKSQKQQQCDKQTNKLQETQLWVHRIVL